LCDYALRYSDYVARILFSTFGSYGDVHPYMALGLALQQRGHEVTIATSPFYKAKVESEKLKFHAVRPDVDLENRELLQLVFDPVRGSEYVVRYLAENVEQSYNDLLPAAQETDLIVTHPVTFASVLAAQKLNLRWASSVLAPISFLSAYDPPAPSPFPWLPKLRIFGPGVMRHIWEVGKRESLRWIGPLFKLRQQLELGPTEHPIFEGSHSPSLVLALFSATFAPPQPDWPRGTVVTGFPFYDRHHESAGLSEGLQEFLAKGSPPVVFTLGSSAVGAAGDFYLTSLEAAWRLGTRALLLTGPHPQGLPAALPEGVHAVAYAPHSEVFPRAAAIVHQGGIGTTAQALRSGRPQLVVPFSHDQFDNAMRVRRLGCGEQAPQRSYSVGRAEAVLRKLTGRGSYSGAAARVSERIRSEDGCATAADALERLLARDSGAA
jgi:rhamnosyltransferase subunit B